ncbi:MAG TPA: DUF1003 domain-containing protein [Planctomycetaceae bacterium]|nr:DUF1003 domain-containing protein [Planctomycetaceae bacterium]
MPKTTRSRTPLGEITQRNVELIAKIEAHAQNHATMRERYADLAVAIIGSWTFLIGQAVLLVVWMAVNLIAWSLQWDPFPFILLNLVLSFQAAFATPMILMSQNRQARLSERRNELDLQINLLAEQENTEQLRLLRLVCERLNIEIDDPEMEAFVEAVDPDELVQQIVETMEAPSAATASEKPHSR